MQTKIPNGLRTIYLIHFIWELIFGLAGTLAAKLVGDIAGYPVTDPVLSGLLGLAALAFALASWFAYRATSWEQISILTAAESFFNLVGGIGGVILSFTPSVIGLKSIPPVQLLVSVVLTLFGIAFVYFYNSVNGMRSPFESK